MARFLLDDIMAVITSEYNYKRKSHRVDIPLLVEINGTVYKAKDWSVSGVGIDEVDQNLNVGDELSAKLTLPMSDAALSMKVTLVFRNTKDRTFGFEFKDLEPKQRRLLRHYIEMAVEGKIDDVEGLIALASSPNIDSPIEEALNLTEVEQGSLTRQFRIRSRLVLAFAALFIALLAATLFYNTTYRIRDVGITVGNTHSIQAPVSGTVTEVFVKNHTEVSKGDPLYAISDDWRQRQMDNVSARIAAIETQLAGIEEAIKRTAANEDAPDSAVTEAQNAAVRLATDIAEERKQAYESARQLYDQRLMTKKDLDYRENQYRQAELVRQREAAKLTKEDGGTTNLDRLRRQQFEFSQQLIGLRQQLASLSEGSPTQVVRAPTAGRLYSLFVVEGDAVRQGDTHAILATKSAPRIALTLRKEQLLKLKYNTRAEIYSPTLDKHFPATLVAFGRRSLDAGSSVIDEITHENGVVIFELDNPEQDLLPNEYVDVWVKTFDWNQLLP